MKTLWAATAALASLSPALAADPAPLHFPSERIGVPPLSLSESIADGTTSTRPLEFGGGLPSYSAHGQSIVLSPQLVPRTTPNVLRREAPRSSQAPRISRSSGMPIIEPSDAVDYKMTIIRPDPNVDFKLVIKDSTPEARQETAK
jgi:hypothetical protein